MLFLLALSLLAACRPEGKEIPYTTVEPKWVMNSRVDELGGIWVSLTYSLPANYSGAAKNLAEQLESMMIPNANVQLQLQGFSFRFEEVGKGVYYLNSPQLQEGDIAQIEVMDTQGRLKMKANCKVPARVDLLKNEVIGNKVNADTVFSIDVRIRKSRSGNARYLVSIGKTSDFQRLKSGAKPSLAQVIGDRSFLEKRAFLLQANDFIGDSILFHQRLPFAQTSDTVVVNVAQVDGVYFKYVEEVLRSSGWLQQLLGDAVNFHGNIEYGLGYFTLHQTKSKAFVLRKMVR